MFRLLTVDGRTALDHDGAWYDLARVTGDPALADPQTAIARHRDLHTVAAGLGAHDPDGTVATARLGPPVPRPSKVFGIGLNYGRHALESGMSLPPAPLTFTKFPSCLTGPSGEVTLSGTKVDWEVELVVVIGTGGRHIPRERAWEHVAGLTLGQDISDREVQLTGTPPQFSLGKSFDGYGPIGPAIVSVDGFGDPNDIGLWCEVDGERVQDGRTSDLLFPVDELIAYLSGICTLEPGDLIFTGTPDGVGMARGRFLQPGSTLVSGAEVIGAMTHRFVAAA